MPRAQQSPWSGQRVDSGVCPPLLSRHWAGGGSPRKGPVGTQDGALTLSQPQAAGRGHLAGLLPMGKASVGLPWTEVSSRGRGPHIIMSFLGAGGPAATDEDMEVTAGPREECGGSELGCGAGATACRARGSTQVSTSPQTPDSVPHSEPSPWSPSSQHPQSRTPWQLTPFTRAHPPLGTLPAGAAPPGAPSPPDRAGLDLPQRLQPTALPPTPHPHPTLSTRPTLGSRPSCPAPSTPAHSLPAARPAPLRCGGARFCPSRSPQV